MMSLCAQHHCDCFTGPEINLEIHSKLILVMEIVSEPFKAFQVPDVQLTNTFQTVVAQLVLHKMKI